MSASEAPFAHVPLVTMIRSLTVSRAALAAFSIGSCATYKPLPVPSREPLLCRPHTNVQRCGDRLVKVDGLIIRSKKGAKSRFFERQHELSGGPTDRGRRCTVLRDRAQTPWR